MCINEIINNIQDIKLNTWRLRNLSLYYPALYCEHNDDINYITILIRKRADNGKWYTIHLLKSFKDPRNSDIIIRMIMLEAYNIKYLYIIQPDIDIIDELQITEEERLRNDFKDFEK